MRWIEVRMREGSSKGNHRRLVSLTLGLMVLCLIVAACADDDEGPSVGVSGGGAAAFGAPGGDGGRLGGGGSRDAESDEGGRLGGGGAVAGDAAEEGIGGHSPSAGMGGEGGSPIAARIQWLGDCRPIDLSKDGKTALAIEGIWTEGGGWEALPDLPGGTNDNSPRALSRDGQVVFGLSTSEAGLEAYRWTAAAGIEGLGVGLIPFAANLDGSVMVGWNEETGGPFVWTAAAGINAPAPYLAADSMDEALALVNEVGDVAHFSLMDYGSATWVRWTDLAGWPEPEVTNHWVTAAAADGTRPALHTPRVTTYSFEATGGCMRRLPPFLTQPLTTPESCTDLNFQSDGTWVYLFDYDTAAKRGVGFEWPASEPEDVQPFFWSEHGQMRPLKDVLPQNHDIELVVPASIAWAEMVGTTHHHPHLSGDGQLLLARDETRGCFIAEIEERSLCDGCSGVPGQLDTGPTDSAVEWIGACQPVDLNADGTEANATRGHWTDGVGWSAFEPIAAVPFPAAPPDLDGECLAAATGGSCVGFEAVILDYSADGTRAVGYEYFEDTLDRAFFWSSETGLLLLADVIAGGHADLPYPGQYRRRGEDQVWKFPETDGHPHISADGTKILSRDEKGDCFIAKLNLPP